MGHYRFLTDWEVDAPVDRVWDALLAAGNWPAWWKGFRAVESLDPGEASGIGMRLRQRWRSLLPYTLTFDLEIDQVQRHRLLAGRASGDVAGTCRWTFEPDGDVTRVRFLMDVRTTRAWMNLPVPFARQVFALNFGTIMRWGSEGLARLLGTRVVHRTAEAPSPA